MQPVEVHGDSELKEPTAQKRNGAFREIESVPGNLIP